MKPNETQNRIPIQQINQSNLVQSTGFPNTSLNTTDENDLAVNYDDVQESRPIDFYREDNFEDNSIQELQEVFLDQDITPDQLAAGYLTAFFNGRTSKKSLSDYL